MFGESLNITVPVSQQSCQVSEQQMTYEGDSGRWKFYICIIGPQKNENVFSNEEIEFGCSAFDVQMMILSSSTNTPLMIATNIYPRLQLSYKGLIADKKLLLVSC